MHYLEDIRKFTEILQILALHKKDVKDYFLAELAPRMATVNDPKQKIRLLFMLSNADRTSTGLENKGLVQSAQVFSNELDNLITACTKMTPKLAHSTFLEFLCNEIPGMDQKTANLFLKYLAMFQDEFGLGVLNWISWEPFLHVPLDIWVLRLISRKYLNVCNQAYENDFKQVTIIKKTNRKIEDYPSPLFTQDRYTRLQNDFSIITTTQTEPIITLDILWFIGSKYCSYRPLLCDICWVNEFCSNKKVVDWSSTNAKRKSELRKDRSEAAKARAKNLRSIVRKIENKYQNDYPGGIPFEEFVKTQSSQAWLSKTLKEPLT
jgi:hypothetical protein